MSRRVRPGAPHPPSRRRHTAFDPGRPVRPEAPVRRAVGFPLVLHPRDPKALRVFPMDGGTVWPRVPIGGRPAVYGSRDAGAGLAQALAELDRQFPGIRFRMIDEQDAIRPHITLFVNREQVRRLDVALRPPDEVRVVAALSGG